MKALRIVLLSLLSLAGWVMTRPAPVLRPYPQVFTALFNESDAAVLFQPRMMKVYVDVPNKRARIGNADSSSKWLLIYRPGGDPTDPTSQNYTLFAVNPNYPAVVPSNCYYATYNLPSYAPPFPESWTHATNIRSVMEVEPWYDLPDDLFFSGPYYIEELGVMSDRWDSKKICDLRVSGIGKVPCRSVMYTQVSNPLPLMDIRAFGSHSLQSDSYKVRVYHAFKTTVQDSDFDLPDDWLDNCGNADNGFIITPENAVTVYQDGGSPQPVTLRLTAPPVVSQGDAYVYLTPTPSWYYNCVDCVSVGLLSLTFTHDNWNVPQELPMKFLRNGCTQFIVEATGGGYGWTYSTHSFIAYTCQGNAAVGCTTQPKCGDSFP